MHDGNDLQDGASATTLLCGNLPETSSFRAFRDAVRGLHNMDDFDKEKIGSGFYGEVYKVTRKLQGFLRSRVSGNPRTVPSVFFSVLCQVTHKRSGQVVVLKINKSADNRSRSLREIQILNKLEHPHILR